MTTYNARVGPPIASRANATTAGPGVGRTGSAEPRTLSARFTSGTSGTFYAYRSTTQYVVPGLAAAVRRTALKMASLLERSR